MPNEVIINGGNRDFNVMNMYGMQRSKALEIIGKSGR